MALFDYPKNTPNTMQAPIIYMFPSMIRMNHPPFRIVSTSTDEAIPCDILNHLCYENEDDPGRLNRWREFLDGHSKLLPMQQSAILIEIGLMRNNIDLMRECLDRGFNPVGYWNCLTFYCSLAKPSHATLIASYIDWESIKSDQLEYIFEYPFRDDNPCHMEGLPLLLSLIRPDVPRVARKLIAYVDFKIRDPHGFRSLANGRLVAKTMIDVVLANNRAKKVFWRCSPETIERIRDYCFGASADADAEWKRHYEQWNNIKMRWHMLLWRRSTRVSHFQ